MPELPEVETMRRDLQALADRAVVTAVDVRDEKIIQGSAEVFENSLSGRQFKSFARRGKVLILGLDDGSMLLAHPRMTGRFLVVGPEHELPRHARAVLHLDNGLRLVFDDSRRFGRLEWVAEGQLEQAVLLRRIGRDALAVDPQVMQGWLKRHRVPVKVALLDQRVISGIGNIYASEILHRCGLDPRTPSCRISPQEAREIARQTEIVLAEGVAHRGTTLSDYRTPNGEHGGYQRRLQVYGRQGEPCLRSDCPGTIQKMTLGGRSTYACSHCQRTGRTRRAT